MSQNASKRAASYMVDINDDAGGSPGHNAGYDSSGRPPKRVRSNLPDTLGQGVYQQSSPPPNFWNTRGTESHIYQNPGVQLDQEATNGLEPVPQGHQLRGHHGGYPELAHDNSGQQFHQGVLPVQGTGRNQLSNNWNDAPEFESPADYAPNTQPPFFEVQEEDDDDPLMRFFD